MTATTNDYRTISVQELATIASEGQEIQLIDVRTPAEFEEVHSIYARNIPLDQIASSELAKNKGAENGQPVYVICRSGNRSTKACEALVKAGCQNIVNVEGGTNAWEQAGLPVKRGKKTISLERQVRIAAGFLVLTGAVLGFFVHPYWIALSAFVGAGLMFAGITDTCGMAMILAKMPWNQASSCSANSGCSADTR